MFIMDHTTSATTVNQLQEKIAYFGLPETIFIANRIGLSNESYRFTSARVMLGRNIKTKMDIIIVSHLQQSS